MRENFDQKADMEKSLESRQPFFPVGADDHRSADP
jgi:hypothetical protein